MSGRSMKKLIPSILFFCLLVLTCRERVFASETNEQKEGAVSSDGMAAKSIDQMIQEHHWAAEEMLETSLNLSDEGQQAKTVDDVYSQHSQYYATERSLDDLENRHRLEFEDLSRDDTD